MFEKNAGKDFEEWIEYSNRQYEARGMAVINKIATPWNVTRKFSPYKKTYEIVSAFPMSKSTVDFGGTASEKSVWFEAKRSKHKTSFPLRNIHTHQMDYLEKVDKQGGKAFFLVYSEEFKKVWLLWISQLLDFIKTSGRKSIPFDWFEKNCTEIKAKNGVVLDYLSEVLK